MAHYAIARVAAPPRDAPPDLIALSVTYLQGAYVGDRFERFRELEPIARAGHSILLYDYSAPRVRLAARAAF